VAASCNASEDTEPVAENVSARPTVGAVPTDLTALRSGDSGLPFPIDGLLHERSHVFPGDASWPTLTYLVGEVHRRRGDSERSRKAFRELAIWAAGDPYGDTWGGSGLAALALWRWLQILDRAAPSEAAEVDRALEGATVLGGTRLYRGMVRVDPLQPGLPQLDEGVTKLSAHVAWKNDRKDAAMAFSFGCGKKKILLQSPLVKKPDGTTQLTFEPKEPLVAISKPNSKVKNDDGGYEILEAKFSANKERNEIFAKVTIKSFQGETEVVEMAGKIRADHSATLVDLNPPAPDRHRLTAEALCVDDKDCNEIILDITYKVGSKEYPKQFVSETLLKSNPVEEEANDDDEQGDGECKSHQECEGDFDDLESVEDENEDKDKDKTDTPDGTENLDDATDELTGKDEPGDFVGASPNKEAKKILWKRPEEKKESPAEQGPSPSEAKPAKTPKTTDPQDRE